MRYSPEKPAKYFKMNTIKKGILDNEYIVAKRTNGIKYWKKLSHIEKKCRKSFKKKLQLNLQEYKKGKYKNNKQALAVTYNQVIKKNKDCKKFYTKKSK